MAVRIMAQIWESDRPWTGSTLLVMLALADYANDDGYLWPSIASVAKKCRLSERQTQRIIHELIDDGALEVAQQGDGRGHTTFYRIKSVVRDTLSSGKGDNSDRVSSVKGVTSDRVSEIKRVTSATQKGDIQRERVTSSAVKGDIAMSPDPLVDPSLDPSRVDPSVSGSAKGKKSSKSKPPPPPTPPNPHQQMFGKICEIVGWDYRTLGEKSKTQVAQTAKILAEAGYSPADLDNWWEKVWKYDWRWTKEHSRPTLNQLRQEIGKLKTSYAPTPENKPNVYANGVDPPGRRLTKAEESMAAVDRVMARLEREEAGDVSDEG